MNKITIGIPKALLYYKYSELWTTFFEELGCDIIISPNTSKKIFCQLINIYFFISSNAILISNRITIQK